MKLQIIEAPSNLGLIEPSPNKEPGVSKLPAWLKEQGFYTKLSPERVVATIAPQYSMSFDEVSGVRNADCLAEYSKKLSIEVQDSIKSGYFPIVIGGDCSVLIGCALALKSIGKYGLFFIDGHTDFVMPHTSRAKGAAGMDLAIVTGHGHEKLTNIGDLKPYFEEQLAVAFGNRYLQEDYVDMILKSSIVYFDLYTIREFGIENIVTNFIRKLVKEKANGFWIHLDVDVLNDELMPCVDSRQPGGLSYDELKLVLHLLLSSHLIVGLDITILDPDLDEKAIYTKKFINEISELF